MRCRLFAAAIVSIGLLSPAVAQSTPDVSGKVVLANLDRYDAYLRVGNTRREIKPKKASVLSPRMYPATIEFWSGNTKVGWRKQTITKAGIYGFNFKRGNWSLTELKKGTTRRLSTRPSSRTVRKRIVRQPTRRLPINADRNRWSPLARAAYDAGKIYQFVRDEQDRELLRNLLIRAREDEDYDRLERWIRDAKIPELYKHDLREAFEDLGRLSDADWKAIDTADEKDWDHARADVGDLISDSDWNNLTTDFAEINTDEFWQDNVDVDLDDLGVADNLDIDLDGDLDLGDLDVAEDFDVGDLGIDTESYDLGGFDDFGGYDGAFDVDPSDFGRGSFGDDDFGDFGGFDDFDF